MQLYCSASVHPTFLGTQLRFSYILASACIKFHFSQKKNVSDIFRNMQHGYIYVQTTTKMVLEMLESFYNILTEKRVMEVLNSKKVKVKAC